MEVVVVERVVAVVEERVGVMEDLDPGMDQDTAQEMVADMVV